LRPRRAARGDDSDRRLMRLSAGCGRA